MTTIAPPTTTTSMAITTSTMATTTTTKAPTTTIKSDSSKAVKPDKKPADRYSCNINDQGFCIFTGQPHQNYLKPRSNTVVDLEGSELFLVEEAVAVNLRGEILIARGTPSFDGDRMSKGSQEFLSEDEKSFHRVMATMFGIRNQLMYNVENLDKEKWDMYVESLAERGIKETTFTDGATPRDNYYGRDGIFELVKNPNGRDIHHDVMKFLEESGLYLLCHVTSPEFNQMLADTHPEGHDPCEDAGIETKIPWDLNETVVLTASVLESPEPTASCTFDESELKVSCEAVGVNQSSELNWTSNATSRWQNGPEWEFTLGEILIPAETKVYLEVCLDEDCQMPLTVSTTLDTAAFAKSSNQDSDQTATVEPIETTFYEPKPPVLQRFPIGPFGPYDLVTRTSGVLRLHDRFLNNDEASIFPPLSEYGRPIGDTKTSWAVGFHVPGDTLVYIPFDSTVESFSWHDSGGQIQSWDDWSIRLKPISDPRPPSPEGAAPEEFTWLVEIDHVVSLDCPRPRIWPERCYELPIIDGVELYTGMTLQEGQVLGYVGHLADYENTGLNGHVEIQVNYITEDWRLTKSYCPFNFLTDTARENIQSEWQVFTDSFESWVGDSSLYEQENEVTTGCRILRADHLNDGSEYGVSTTFTEPE